MKNFLVLFTLMLPFISGWSQDTESYHQYMSIYLKPDLQNLDKLKANMKVHNETYHNEAPYNARVFAVMNGPYSGWWVWQMGPCTFPDLDNRPNSEAHDKHWDNEVLKYCSDYKNFEFWRRDDDQSNLEDQTPPYATVRLRFLEVAKGEDHRVKGLFNKIKETLATMPGENYWGVYDNMFLQGYKQGRHMVTVSLFKTMADLDKNDFVMYYNKKHGTNAFQGLLSDWGSIFTDTYDEFWNIMPEMSGIKN